MDIVENIVSVIETIFGLLVLGSVIWGVTSAFKFKGFVISTGSIALIIIAIIYFEKFINYSIDNKPLLILIVLGLIAIFLIGITIYALKEQFDLYGYDREGRKKIKNFLATSLKQLFWSLFAGFAIVGIIFLFVCQN